MKEEDGTDSDFHDIPTDELELFVPRKRVLLSLWRVFTYAQSRPTIDTIIDVCGFQMFFEEIAGAGQHDLSYDELHGLFSYWAYAYPELEDTDIDFLKLGEELNQVKRFIDDTIFTKFSKEIRNDFKSNGFRVRHWVSDHDAIIETYSGSYG